MYSVRRAPGIHITLARRNAVDLLRLQQGEAELREQEQLVAYIGASGREYILDEDDVRVLTNASSVDWKSAVELSERSGVGTGVIDLLVQFGFLLSDDDSAAQTPKSLALSLWDMDALFYHQRCKWEGQDANLPATAGAGEESRAMSERFFSSKTARQGLIPQHFHERIEREQRLELDLSSYHSPLTEILGLRRTTRLYDTETALAREPFFAVLQHVFGCQGTTRLAEHVTALKKTSPSGGAMHPVEIYPLVIKVNGLEPGIYHYHVGDHALEPMRQCGEDEARQLASVLTAGQNYYSSAHVLFIYTARFERSYWKYSRNPRVYKVVHLDLGHLSQTLYLMCAELGLGAFFTAACNDIDIERELGIDGICEGALGVGGMGLPAVDRDTMGLRVEPYSPRRRQV